MNAAPLQVITELPGELAPFYLMAHLVRRWRELGHQVDVGPCAALGDRVGLAHIDRTFVPTHLIPPGRVINGSALDISKRRVGVTPLTPDSGWSGPVILKTDANFYGLPERAAASRHLPFVLQVARRLAARLVPWRLARRLPPDRYPILPHLSEVPAWVWQDPSLVVQPFTPEREGDGYALRIWVVVGERSLMYRVVSGDPLVKSTRVRSVQVSEELPPEPIQQARVRLGVEIGKLDWVLHRGEPILLDANKTPALGTRWDNRPRNPDRLNHLACGLDSLLERA